MSFRTKITELKLKNNDPEWHDEKYQLDYIVEFLLPRFFRAPFLVSLYAVYESAVTEIANLIQAKKAIEIPIIENKRTFNLEKTKKYYKKIIDFPLSTDNVAWERINMLSIVRHAIAHTNGRIEMIKNEGTRKKVSNWERQNIGISLREGYLVFEKRFLKDTLRLVSASLNDLVERYNKWDDLQMAKAGKPVPPGKFPPP